MMTPVSLLAPIAAALTPPPHARLLVVGASGGTGSRALRGLLDVGYEPRQLRVLTRDPSKAILEPHRGLGIELWAGDLDDPQTLEGAGDGCSGCYVHSTAGDTKQLDTGEVRRARHLAQSLRASGVAHVVYNSAAAEPTHSVVRISQKPTLASTMIYAVAMIPAVLAANTAEVSTSDVRHGAAFDNIKASWGKALNIGDFKTNVRCNYDYNDNRDFLKEVSVSGDLMEGSSSDDLQVSYDLTHNFKSKNTAVKVSAQTQGTTFAAEYDTDSNLKEVSARRDLDLGDQKVDLQPSWLVQAKTARVKMMSALGGSKDRFSAQVDYNVDGGATSYELGYSRNLEDGKEVSATFTPDNKQLEVEYVDSKFENGATWTATATVPMDDSSNVMDSSKLTLKRSWAW